MGDALTSMIQGIDKVFDDASVLIIALTIALLIGYMSAK
jgi:hypothetical protein